MELDRWEQIERLYHAALECQPEAREAFLDEACAGDEDLRREVAGLLACDVPVVTRWQTTCFVTQHPGRRGSADQQLQVITGRRRSEKLWDAATEKELLSYLLFSASKQPA
jgi:hypothetical protein